MPSTMGTWRSHTCDNLEGCDSEIVQLELVNVKWLNGLGKENGLLSPESRGRCPLNPCQECIQPILSVSNMCDSGDA